MLFVALDSKTKRRYDAIYDSKIFNLVLQDSFIVSIKTPEWYNG